MEGVSPASPASPTRDPAHQPTFSGALSIDHGRRGPALSLSFRCPHCRIEHVHSWSLGGDEPQPRVAHCTRPTSPYRFPGPGYLVVPRGSAENRRVLSEFARLLVDHLKSVRDKSDRRAAGSN